jgi:6-phosphogluconolactonase
VCKDEILHQQKPAQQSREEEWENDFYEINYKKLNPLFKIFHTPSELADAFASELTSRINSVAKKGKQFALAVSGGNTPRLLFTILAEKYNSLINWDIVQLFWVDERCVSPDNPESNYGMTKHILLDRINMPESNIHRMKGEEDPSGEAVRYGKEIIMSIRSENQLPLFDQIILGIGDDGHTASIFPGNLKLFDSENFCEVAAHPISGQKRITLTGKVINNSDAVTFLVTGQNKARIISEIYEKKPQYLNYPASFVTPVHGAVEWFIDYKAGELIK